MKKQGRRAGRLAAAKRGASSSVNGLRSFLRLPAATQALALEAAFTLLLARLLVAHVPMRFWRRRLDMAPESSPCPERAESPRQRRSTMLPGADERPAERDDEERRAAARLRIPRKMARVVRKVARRLPFQALCLPQAMAAQWMLRRRSIPSRLVFGARRGRTPERTFEYHAWLMVAGQCVIGGGELDTYVPLSPLHPNGDEPGRSPTRSP